eukprot:TRINITY_DN1547_c0_g2_i2.p1 TRINITY_DN1547_c0_g2~~TRINITY_DN1547_c0_g2_i2.p1  ORF type:complete len:218 (+),score=23.83 TRINITY_DN1547_c0_g2_i2:105-758(+)
MERGRRRQSRSPSPNRYNSRSRSPDSFNPGNNLYVTGLSTRVTEEELRDHFAREGQVTECRLVVDPRTKESRGFAFVTMSATDEAELCIKHLHRSILEGRVISVEKAKRKKARTPTPGKYLGVRTAREQAALDDLARSRHRGSDDRPVYYDDRDRGGYRGRSPPSRYGGGYRDRSPDYGPYRGGGGYGGGGHGGGYGGGYRDDDGYRGGGGGYGGRW